MLKLSSRFNNYPRQIWILLAGTLFNALGQGLVFPFLSLYLTNHLEFTMTQVGVIYIVYAAVATFSQIGIGNLVDRFGRKPFMVIGMFGSGIGVLSMALNSKIDYPSFNAVFTSVIAIAIFMGSTSSAYPMVANTMIADVVEEKKRLSTYGLMRVGYNVGFAFGPVIGGLLAAQSYMLAFSISAALSILFGFIILLFIHESKPEEQIIESHNQEADLKGMLPILGDKIFLAFWALYVFSQIIFFQAETTLPVFLKTELGITEQWYGLLMSMNALMIVFFQLPITRKMNNKDVGKSMALGFILMGLGFSVYGFFDSLWIFFIGQVIWTLGNIILSPVAQTFVSNIAPINMRGRYNGFFNMSFAIANGIGPILGGSILDNLGGRWIWYGSLVLSIVGALGYIVIMAPMKRRLKRQTDFHT
ncbi:MAG: MFS transporter [Anaerolineaceae bacterium]|nr:MFS transporter [Anaerolineaceae bacterium]